MKSLIEIVKEFDSKRAMAVGTAFSARHVPMAAVELIAGISPQDSANARIVGEITNFLATGPGYELGREWLRAKLGISENPNFTSHKWFNGLYGFAAGTVNLGIATAMYYKFYGAKDNLQIFAPAITSVALTMLGGEPIAKLTNTLMEGLGRPLENESTYFPDDMSKESRRILSERIVAGSFAIFSAYILWANAMFPYQKQIYDSIKNLF